MLGDSTWLGVKTFRRSGLYHMKSKAVFKVSAMDSAQLVGTCLASTKPGVDAPALSKLW